MPRASWRGFLRLSLVSCPVLLTPATTRTKTIRLHQVWVPDSERSAPAIEPPEEAEEPRLRPPPRLSEPSMPAPADAENDDFRPATRVSLRPHDPHTGEEVERDEVVKGYEYQRGQFVTLTAAELKGLNVESSKTIDLASFVPRAEVDPVYFSTPYYVYPDRAIAQEPFRVIGAAMRAAGMVGIGRLTLSRRERMVMIEPRGAGMALITLRAADEVRAADFTETTGEIDPEMIELATAIIARRTGAFDPASFRDTYQEALRRLVEAKLRGLPMPAEPAAAPAPVVDLMAALKRSLANEPGQAAQKARGKAAPDRRQRNLLLPVGGKERPHKASTGAAAAGRRRRKA